MPEPFASFDKGDLMGQAGLNALLEHIIEQGMVVVIIKTGPFTLFEKCRFKEIYLHAGKRFKAYSVSASEHIPHGVRYLEATRLWHFGVFHILVGHRDLTDLMCGEQQYDNKGGWPEKISDLVVGTMEPVDNELLCYGVEPFRSVVLRQPKVNSMET